MSRRKVIIKKWKSKKRTGFLKIRWQRKKAGKIVKTGFDYRNTFNDESDNEDQSMMVKDESDSNNEDILALIANSNSAVEDDQTE